MPDKTKGTLTRVFKRLLAKIKRQFGSQVVIVRLDMEAGYVELLEICRDLGIALEPRATEAQNGGIERAGKSIVIRARAIRLHAGLPKEYANECAMTAIYLLNRTPVEAINWSCPYTKVKGVKPSVAHLEVIGARAYVLNEKLPRGAKLDSRALIGHLVGFDSANIFRVWLPTIGRVIRTRDVVFLRDKLCDGQGQYAEKSYVREVAEVLDIEETPDYSNILTEQLSSPRIEEEGENENNEEENADEIGDTIHVKVPPKCQQGSTQQKTTTALMTPDATPESPELTQLTGESLTNHLMDDTGWGRGYALAPEGEEPDRKSNNAARRGEISSQVSEQFIVEGKRSRKPARFGTYLATFAACINPTASEKLLSEAPKIRLHRDQLPAEPKRWKDLDQHPFGAEFKKASRKEINGFVAVASKNKDVYRQFDQQLRAAYDVRFLGELKWFLGIRVIRDRGQKKIWLMQDSFIDKVAAKYNIAQESTRYPAVPLVSAAYHAWKYLIGQKRLAIGAHGDQSSRTIYTGSSLGGAKTEPLFYGASDAAFADDLPTRRSSQGYLFTLYGMPIDWKATLQRSVTKSTTEAELLALSTAASELQAWNRLFKHIKLDLEMVPTIYCDNLQTVGVVTKHEDKLFTP
ncbi:Pol protein [Pyrenophora tritici-repentis]|nr:Pol protein [Pyrenophora tritici-repentis]